MDDRLVVGAVVTAVVATVGFFVRRQVLRIDVLEGNVAAIQLNVAQNYVPRSEHARLETKLEARFDKTDSKLDIIYEKLGDKADK